MITLLPIFKAGCQVIASWLMSNLATRAIFVPVIACPAIVECVFDWVRLDRTHTVNLIHPANTPPPCTIEAIYNTRGGRTSNLTISSILAPDVRWRGASTPKAIAVYPIN